jgi:error-prone DNA polymerase
MDKNKISPKVQEEVIQYITSFALYGFPESHAASFALIAYASAFLKVRYLAAFTTALLNNWPMGFYHPSTIVQDAKRYGLKFNPIDVTRSNWECTIELERGQKVVRMGLRYAKGLQQSGAEALVKQRSYAPFTSVEDLTRRIPQLNRDNLAKLAKIGALNELCNDGNRRDALWQVRKAILPPGPLFEGVFDMDPSSPLRRMDIQERVEADYRGTGLTVGPHLLAYRRQELKELNVISALDLTKLRNGLATMVAGQVIACQRPGTAKGIMFMTLEDETGISRAIIHPEIYDKDPMAVLENSFVIVAGVVQNREKVIHIQAENIIPLNVGPIQLPGHYFH